MLTIGRLPVLVPLGPTNLAKRSEDVVNALSELVRYIKDRSTDETSTLDSPKIRAGQIILMNNRTPSPWGSNPRHLPGVCTREQHVPKIRTGTANDQGGPNYDTVYMRAVDHVALMCRSLSCKRVRRRGRGGVDDDFVTVVAVNPNIRGFHVIEPRGVSRADGFRSLGY